MKTQDVCPHCGHTVSRVALDLGYARNGPAGSKGRDEFAVHWECPVHGEVNAVPREVSEWFDRYEGRTYQTPRGDSLTVHRGYLEDRWGNIVYRLPQEPVDIPSIMAGNADEVWD